MLKSKFNIPKPRKTWERIYDERQPKKPITPYFHFSRARFGAGNRGDASVMDMQKENAELWRNMTPAQQQVRETQAEVQ